MSWLQDDAYRMLLYILVGSLLPYIETLDSWLFQGTLDDPFDEVFIFSYLLFTIWRKAVRSLTFLIFYCPELLFDSLYPDILHRSAVLFDFLF